MHKQKKFLKKGGKKVLYYLQSNPNLQREPIRQ